MGKWNSELLGQGRWIPQPSSSASLAAAGQKRWQREGNSKSVIITCSLSENRWKAQPIADQETGSIGLWPGGGISSEAASTKGLPYFQSQARPPLDFCNICFVLLCIQHILSSTRALWVSSQVIVTRGFGAKRKVLETKKLMTREAK